MPALPTTKPTPDLERALGAEGEKEYRRLLRALRRARGDFFLFPIESDLPNHLRNALLERLRADLSAEGSCLRVAAVNRREWNVFALPALEMPVTESDVVVLVGLEDTPGIVPEIGAEPVRPPALALLNQQRESLHQHVPAPFLVWCPPYVFTTLMEQAPDFFAHYASLFHFPNATPERTDLNLTKTTGVTIRDYAARQEQSVPSPTSVAFYEQQIKQHSAPTRERAYALLGLADALMHLHGPNYPQHVQRVLQVVEEALSLLSPQRDAYVWARGQGIKGIAYFDLLTGDRVQNLQQAMACYVAALHVYTEADFPHEWAMTQDLLGNVYCFLPIGDRTQNLQHAIDCYKSALRVHTEAIFPQDWAMVQNNLGNAYYFFPVGDRAQNLQKAIICYEAALNIFTELDFPREWAMAQNHLGNAYYSLPIGNRIQNLQQAIACYEAALRIRTEANFPQEWAKTQNNLGNAYLSLPTSDRTQNLQCAVDCYKATLRVYTETDFTRDWANTQFNLALAQERLGDRDAARQAICSAIAGYRQVGLETQVERAENLLRELDEA